MTEKEQIEQLRKRIDSETEEERAARLAKAAQDPDRPLYHYLPPPGWINDPNGTIFWKGKYHVFYQYTPDKPFWQAITWGHTVSEDLVHWKHLPVALAPTPGGPDKDGCFSGCAVDNDGVPTILYTGVFPKVHCIATSGDEMLTWQKYEGNPLISAPPDDLDVTFFNDPCAWKVGDTWYVLIGAGIKDAGGTCLLYKSRDLINYEYMHLFYEPVSAQPKHLCPDFFPLGNKHVLLTIAPEALMSPGGTQWDVGTYAGHRFTSERTGQIDWGNHTTARTLVDDRGRRILWGWIPEGRSEEEQIRAGWSGVLSLPRILTLQPDDTLGIDFAPELRTLRGSCRSFENTALTPSDKLLLDGVQGECIEVIARFALGDSKKLSIIVQGVNTITYDREGQHLLGAPLQLAPDEDLRLHIYVDRSVIEVIANGRTAKTIRSYDRDRSNLGVSVIANEGSARLKSIDVWEMKSIGD